MGYGVPAPSTCFKSFTTKKLLGRRHDFEHLDSSLARLIGPRMMHYTSGPNPPSRIRPAIELSLNDTFLVGSLRGISVECKIRSRGDTYQSPASPSYPFHYYFLHFSLKLLLFKYMAASSSNLRPALPVPLLSTWPICSFYISTDVALIRRRHPTLSVGVIRRLSVLS